MMFTKYLVVVDDDVDVHNTSEVLFRLSANTDPQRDSIFTKGTSESCDHAYRWPAFRLHRLVKSYWSIVMAKSCASWQMKDLCSSGRYLTFLSVSIRKP